MNTTEKWTKQTDIRLNESSVLWFLWSWYTVRIDQKCWTLCVFWWEWERVARAARPHCILSFSLLREFNGGGRKAHSFFAIHHFTKQVCLFNVLWYVLIKYTIIYFNIWRFRKLCNLRSKRIAKFDSCDWIIFFLSLFMLFVVFDVLFNMKRDRCVVFVHLLNFHFSCNKLLYNSNQNDFFAKSHKFIKCPEHQFKGVSVNCSRLKFRCSFLNELR